MQNTTAPTHIRAAITSYFHDSETDGAQRIIMGERAVWRAVILQALEDAVSNSPKSQDRYHKEQALHWLSGSSQDFTEVCDYAGWDPAFVRKRVKRALLNGCQWRKETSKKGTESKKAQRKLKQTKQYASRPAKTAMHTAMLPMSSGIRP